MPKPIRRQGTGRIAQCMAAFLCAALPLAAAAGFYPLKAAGILYLLYALQVFSTLRRLGSYRPLTALLYPAGLVFFFGVFARSWLLKRSGRVEWKGRRIENGPPGSG